MIVRFEALPTIDGYDVIDCRSGRPIDHRATKMEAVGAAQRLNYIAEGGPVALSKALSHSPGRRSNPSSPQTPDDPWLDALTYSGE